RFPAERLSAEFRSLLAAEIRSGLVAEFRSLLFPELQTHRCTEIRSCCCAGSAQTGSGPFAGSHHPRDIEGYSVVAAARRRCVGVAHPELRNPAGGSEENIPSTQRAVGAGECAAWFGGAVDDGQHPASECARPDSPDSKKIASFTASAA